MDVIRLLFTFNGRISRAEYWLAFTAYVIVFFVESLVSRHVESATLAGLVTVAMWVSGIAVGIKRLHDRGKSGWYVVLFYIVPMVLFLAGVMIGMSHGGSTAWGAGLWLIALSIWCLVELGFLRGAVGANAYGPDPLASAPPATPPTH